MMTTWDIREVTVEGKDIDVVTKFVLLGTLITKDGLYGKKVRRGIAMGKAAMEGQRSNAGYEGETSESCCVPDCTIRSGDMDNEKT